VSQTKKIVIDSELCIGCAICELICSMIKEHELNPRLSRIKVIRIDEEGINIPVVCELCADSPCISSCPTNAIYKHPATYAIIIDNDRCIGCTFCIERCPVGAIDLTRARACTCDLCAGEPQCVKFCPTLAINFISPFSA